MSVTKIPARFSPENLSFSAQIAPSIGKLSPSLRKVALSLTKISAVLLCALKTQGKIGVRFTNTYKYITFYKRAMDYTAERIFTLRDKITMVTLWGLFYAFSRHLSRWATTRSGCLIPDDLRARVPWGNSSRALLPTISSSPPCTTWKWISSRRLH